MEGCGMPQSFHLQHTARALSQAIYDVNDALAINKEHSPRGSTLRQSHASSHCHRWGAHLNCGATRRHPSRSSSMCAWTTVG